MVRLIQRTEYYREVYTLHKMTCRNFFKGVYATCIYFFFIGFLFFSPHTFLRLKRAFAAVVINEIYPKTADVKQEFIELYNTGQDIISLDRWKLEHTEGDKKVFILNASARIPANGFLTFYQTQTDINLSPDGDTIVR